MYLNDLNELYRHMEWADASVWRAVLASDTARDDVKLRELFYHVHMVQRAFLRVWQGETRYTPFPTFADNSSLIEWGRGYYPDAFAQLKSWTDDDLSKPLNVPWASMVEKLLGRAPADTTLGQTAQQVALHSLYHRGQVNARLRELGGEPPLVDYIAWLWLGRPQADWNFWS
jgi:uncharacterized damage-inducible protein DinB